MTNCIIIKSKWYNNQSNSDRLDRIETALEKLISVVADIQKEWKCSKNIGWWAVPTLQMQRIYDLTH